MRSAGVFVVVLGLAAPAAAQIVESVGSRAQGMGGAFVAVANDSSAAWWNPAGLADGPFMDMAISRAVTESTGELPYRRDRVSGFALGTPPFGISYYRFGITDIQPSSPTAVPAADREEGRAGVPVRSLAVRSLGVTLLQTLVQGVTVGSTLKYIRGTLRTGRADGLLPADELLGFGEDLEGGEGEKHFDLDVGVMAIAGPVRIGGVARNLRQVEFGGVEFGAVEFGGVESGGGAMRLPRQVRVGAAFDAAKSGGPPLTIAVDADVATYTVATRERRVIAVGGEQWLFARRLGIRAGARFNRAGAEERSGTFGASVSPRAGLYLDAHVVRGGSADDRGWGAAARVSF